MATIFVASLIFLAIEINARVSVTTSPSLDYRVFFVLQRMVPNKPVKVDRGDYVVSTIQSDYINGGKPIKVTKKVGCASGDSLRVERKKYFCNGKLLGQAKEFLLNGRKLSQFEYSVEIPKGNLFLIGDHKDSIDSRYLGFVSEEDVTAVVYPIF